MAPLSTPDNKEVNLERIHPKRTLIDHMIYVEVKPFRIVSLRSGSNYCEWMRHDQKTLLTIGQFENLINKSNEFFNSINEANEHCKNGVQEVFVGVFLMYFSNSRSIQIAYEARLVSSFNPNKMVVKILGSAENIHLSKDYKTLMTHTEKSNVCESSLSKREEQVLNMLSTGKRVKEVASILFLSPYTIETHIQNIYKKLNISTMVELGKMAERLGVSS